jgi:hypothetical protein
MMLWDDKRISSEAEDAREELDGSLYVRHVISQLLWKMRTDYEVALAKRDATIAELIEANNACTLHIASQMERINRFVELVDQLERREIQDESQEDADTTR